MIWLQIKQQILLYHKDIIKTMKDVLGQIRDLIIDLNDKAMLLGQGL